MKNLFRHLSSFIAPIVAVLVFPYLIIALEQMAVRPAITSSISQAIVGSVIAIAGLIVSIMAVRLFILIGNGTIMPWDPTRKLIIVGLYRHVRNPMILGLIVTQMGEALLFASYGVAILAILIFIINTIYVMYSEEPGLEKRFGQEYLDYKKNVPRWIPRIKPWKPAEFPPASLPPASP